MEQDECKNLENGYDFSYPRFLRVSGIYSNYRPRKRVGKGFTPVCLSVCLCIRVITFEPLDLLI